MQSGFVERGSFVGAMGRNGPITKCQGETQVNSNKVLIQLCQYPMLIPAFGVSAMPVFIFISVVLLVPDDLFF